MDKIIMTEKDVDEIDKWFKENYDNIDTNGYIPFEKVELNVVDRGISIRCYDKGTYANVFLFIDSVNKGYFRFDRNTLKIIKNKIVGKERVSKDFPKALMTHYLLTMMYIIEHKPVLEPKEVKESKKKHKRSHKTESSVTYLFNRHYITNSNTTPKKHKACEFSFKVRGHFRHLKNGKRIWIREYVKGKDKPKERVYKL